MTIAAPHTPNLSGAWVGHAGVLHFNFLHRFTASSQRACGRNSSLARSPPACAGERRKTRWRGMILKNRRGAGVGWRGGALTRLHLDARPERSGGRSRTQERSARRYARKDQVPLRGKSVRWTPDRLPLRSRRPGKGGSSDAARGGNASGADGSCAYERSGKRSESSWAVVAALGPIALGHALATQDPGDQSYRDPIARMHTMGKGTSPDNGTFESIAAQTGGAVDLAARLAGDGAAVSRRSRLELSAVL